MKARFSVTYIRTPSGLMEAKNLLVKDQHLTNHSTRKGGITMKKFLTLVSALVILALFTGLGGAEQKPATQESEQNMCSQTKMRLQDQIGTAEACAENANKKGRASDAKNCWNAFPSKTDVMSDRAQAEVIPESECPPIGPGEGSTGLKISCYHSGYLVWCCGGGRCCDSAYGGYGCWSQ